MTEAPGRSDLAARYPRPEVPGVVWLRAHPPFRGGLRGVARWAAALVLVEVLAGAAGGVLFTAALVDLLLVPGGLVIGCWGLVVRRRRRVAAQTAARSMPAPDARPVDALPAAGLGGVAQQWDLLVHGVLLVNLAVFGAMTLLAGATGADPGTFVLGPIMIASALIPASVLATWTTAAPRTVEGEALAIVHGVGRPVGVRRARWLVRIALAPHIVLALVVITAVLHG